MRKPLRLYIGTECDKILDRELFSSVIDQYLNNSDLFCDVKRESNVYYLDLCAVI